MPEDLKSIQISSELHDKVNIKRVRDRITLREAAERSLTAYVEDKI
jgi:hypothetical protein